MHSCVHTQAWDGPRPGFVYKRDELGLGYYVDALPHTGAVPMTARAQAPSAGHPSRGAGGGE